MKRYNRFEKKVDKIGNDLKEKDKTFYNSVIEQNYKSNFKVSLRKNFKFAFVVCSLVIIFSLSIFIPFLFKDNVDKTIEYQGQVLYVESNLDEVNNVLNGFNICIPSENITVNKMYDDITGDTLYFKLIYEDYDNFEFFEFYIYVNKYFRHKQVIVGESTRLNINEFNGKYRIIKTLTVDEYSEAEIQISFGTQSAYILYSSYTEDVSLKVEQVLNIIIKKE